MATRKTKPKGKARPRAKGEPAPLTFRQKMFVAYYLGKAGGNATEAARLAGYAAPAIQGHENLRKPNIRAAIDAKLDSAAMSADEVLARLSVVAGGDFSPFLKTGRGKPSIDLKALIGAGFGYLVKAIKHTKFGVNVEFHDPMAALEKLGRYHALFADKAEVGVQSAADAWGDAARVAGETSEGAEGAGAE